MKIAGQTLPHESARGHVTGEALYTDDLLLRFPGILHAWPVMAPHAHALVVRLDAASAIDEPGVIGNRLVPLLHDRPTMSNLYGVSGAAPVRLSI